MAKRTVYEGEKPGIVLCRACVIVREQPQIHPVHVVHPVTGEARLFDVYGIASCPMCNARWRRVRNVYELVTA